MQGSRSGFVSIRGGTGLESLSSVVHVFLGKWMMVEELKLAGTWYVSSEVLNMS